MNLSAIIAIFVLVLYTVEGTRTYGHLRKKSFVGSKSRKLRTIGPLDKKKLSHKKLIDPCPYVKCKLEHIPLKCRKPTYFLKNGVKCKGCDKNMCHDELAMFKKERKPKTFKKFLKDQSADIPQKRKDVVEIAAELPVELPVRVNMRRPVPVRGFRQPLPGDSIGPLDKLGFNTLNEPPFPTRQRDSVSPLDLAPKNTLNEPPFQARLRDSLGPLEIALRNNMNENLIQPRQRDSVGPLDISPRNIPNVPLIPPRQRESVGPLDIAPRNIPNEPLIPPRQRESVGPLDIAPRNTPNERLIPIRPRDSVGPLDVAPRNTPNEPLIPTSQRDSVGPTEKDLLNTANRLPVPTGQKEPIVDPVQALNSPPSDSAFVQRLRFDQDNINLLQPPIDEPVSQSPSLDQTNPLIGQRQINSDVQNLQRSQEMLMMQNQQLMAQLQAQQAVLQQLQGQQPFSGFQGPQVGQVQVPVLPPNNGMSQNMQGFPMWGQNPNPFMNGQQQTPGSNFDFTTDFNRNAQMPIAQFLNQIPPVPGINTNFPGPGMVPGINTNFQGQGAVAGINANFPGQGTVQGINPNFPGQGIVPGINSNFQGLQTAAGMNNNNFPGQGTNSWTGTQGMNTESLSLIDPVTNQPLTGSSNSLHGPINSQ